MAYREIVGALIFLVVGSLQAAQPTRTWEFDLKAAGTYKVQVEHVLNGIQGLTSGVTKVTYSISIGNETRSQERLLVADRPFIPLTIEIPSPQQLRVRITGLSGEALKRTYVYTYDAHSIPEGAFFNPIKSKTKDEVLSNLANERLIPAEILNLVNLPEQQIDVGIAALTFAKEIYPNVDIQAYSRRLDTLANKVRSLIAGNGDPETRIRALNTVIYRDEGFHYDRASFSRSRQEYYFLSGILDKKQGICYTMPLLYIAVAQRLGYPIYPVSVPDHLFVRYVDPAFEHQNIETTSGGKFFTDESYINHFAVSKQGIASGTYMHTMTYREFLGYLLQANANVFAGNGQVAKAIAYLQKAVQVNPNYAEHYENLYLAYSAISQNAKGDVAENSRRKAELYARKAAQLGYVDSADIPLERGSLRGAP